MIERDVIIIGAGASGLMCAATAGYRGKRVLVLDHANKAGKKILMSGGGRCNFTNLDACAKHFLSENPSFCISALKRYTPQDFVELVDRHGLEYVEKTPGQLFCQHSAKDLLTILLTECEWAGVDIQLSTKVLSLHQSAAGMVVTTHAGEYLCQSLVIATGGLSIPTLGATGLGYQIAQQFGLTVWPTRAGLVPLTLQPHDKIRFSELPGVSCEARVRVDQHTFKEPLLFTHRGLSGPAMLQISNYWLPGETIHVDLLPDQNLEVLLIQARNTACKLGLDKWLATYLPKSLIQVLLTENDWPGRIVDLSNETIRAIAQTIKYWSIKPNGTEGYRTAEVTLGGVSTDEVSSKTFESLKVPGLYFIGEVLDVTGWLGGYNFQWAWSSGYCAGQYV